MIFRGHVKEFIASAAGALLAISWFLALRAWFSGASDADWLNFAGVIFGVALTVGTTMGVAWINTQMQDRQAKAYLVEGIDDFIECLDFSEIESESGALGRWAPFKTCRERIDFAFDRLQHKPLKLFIHKRGTDAFWDYQIAEAWQNLDLTDVGQVKTTMAGHTKRLKKVLVEFREIAAPRKKSPTVDQAPQ